jgi:sortase A
MSLNSRPSVSVTIFDRTTLHGSDVPVFSSALKKKVNTPVSRELDEGLAASTLAVLAKLKNQLDEPIVEVREGDISSSRADSFGGQTNEFAQGVEVSLPKKVSLDSDPPTIDTDKKLSTIQPQQSPLFEDPKILWSNLEVIKLHAFLLKKIPIVYTVPKLGTVLLESVHHRGIVDRVILPISRTSTYEMVEPYRFLLQRNVVSVWKNALTLMRFVIGSARHFQDEIRNDIASQKQRIEEHVHLAGHRLGEKKLQVIEEFSFNVNQLRLRREFGLEKLRQRLDRGRADAAATIDRWKAPVVEMPSVRVQFPRLQLPGNLVSIPEEIVYKLLGTKDRMSLFIRNQRLRFSLVTLASRTLIAGSMVLMLLTVGPMVALEAESWRQQIAFSIQNLATQAVEKSYPSPTLPPDATPTPTPTPNPDPDKQFQVIIPKIGVNSKIIANVDASNEKEYTEALKKGVAHAKGTGLPGEANTENKTIFIFGHSTNATWNIAKYNALFYSLKDLSVGDDFSVWFWGREFHYIVSDRKIVEPDDVSFLLPQTIKDQLILQTCWPPGTSSKRLLVIATPTE